MSGAPTGAIIFTHPNRWLAPPANLPRPSGATLNRYAVRGYITRRGNRSRRRLFKTTTTVLPSWPITPIVRFIF